MCAIGELAVLVIVGNHVIATRTIPGPLYASFLVLSGVLSYWLIIFLTHCMQLDRPSNSNGIRLHETKTHAVIAPVVRVYNPCSFRTLYRRNIRAWQLSAEVKWVLRREKKILKNRRPSCQSIIFLRGNERDWWNRISRKSVDFPDSERIDELNQRAVSRSFFVA